MTNLPDKTSHEHAWVIKVSDIASIEDTGYRCVLIIDDASHSTKQHLGFYLAFILGSDNDRRFGSFLALYLSLKS